MRTGITYMQAFYRIYASYTVHIWDESCTGMTKIEAIYIDFSKIISMGLRPKPPQKGKNVKNQKLMGPQKAETQIVVPEAGYVPVTIR